MCYLCVPDVHAFVEGPAGEVAPVWAERDAVDGFLVSCQRVHADAALGVPQAHRGVKRRTAGHSGPERSMKGYSEYVI